MIGSGMAGRSAAAVASSAWSKACISSGADEGSGTSVDEATFARQPISTYSRWCAAARDYRDFVDEYLGKEAADDE